VDECFHRIAVQTGDAMFLPSGRVHAIGAGLVIFEIQQNSDTTFRVHDWNRVGLDGKPRELHVRQSLESIDFEDVEPRLVQAQPERRGSFTIRALVNDPLFRTDLVESTAAGEFQTPHRLCVVACVSGSMVARGNGIAVTLAAGDFCILPAALVNPSIEVADGARFLLVEAGRRSSA
jgi:mannose-6-phosphate isomerase